MPRPRFASVPIEERFPKYVSPEPMSGCWLWTGTYNKEGYAKIRYAGKPHLASRVSLILSGTPIPEGKWALHKCDNPACVNPRHLYLGTVQDNQSDMTTRGRQSKGSSRPCAKLNEQQVREIRAAIGFTCVQLAGRYGISFGIISKIRRKVAWKHVTEGDNK